MTDAAGSVLVGAIESTDFTPDEEKFFASGRAAGVTLFRRNIPVDYRETFKLTRKLQSLRAAGTPPLLVAIDQEGGRVARLRQPFPDEGPALYLAGGRSDRTALDSLDRYGFTVGHSLLQLGINTNFAPVVDILTEPKNDAIGDRVFGIDAATVTSRAGAFLAGMERSGVKGCLKHFPGQGHALVDTHMGRAVIHCSLAELRQRELAPFQSLARSCSMIMVAHCVYSQIDSVEASRSAVVIGQILRKEIGFNGVVVSDDMNMGAIPQQLQDWTSALIDSIVAGVDMLLVCRHLERCQAAWEALNAEAARSPAFRARLEDAARRVTEIRKCF